jgi:hypothetical protein
MKAARFEITDEIEMGGKLRDRGEPGDPREHPGDYLGRLWAVFGVPPETIDDGFSYTVRDRESGLVFRAYSGASGPGYAGDPAQRKKLAKVFDAFDALLDRTKPADVELEIIAYDALPPAKIVIGCERGKPFARLVKTRRPANPKRAKTHDECVAMAEKLGGVYGVAAGFQIALDDLVEVPEELHFGGRLYENFIGLALQPDTGPVLTFDEGWDIEEIGLDEALELSAKAKLWLEAYWRWHDAQGLRRRKLRRRKPRAAR